jgi:hypothetical protein
MWEAAYATAFQIDVDGDTDGDRAGGQDPPHQRGFPEPLPFVGERAGDDAAEVDDDREGQDDDRPYPPRDGCGERDSDDADPDLADHRPVRGNDVQGPGRFRGSRAPPASVAVGFHAAPAGRR